MSVKGQGLCKVILLTAVLSSAINALRNILHWRIYITKENHVVVPHPLIWIKTGLMKLSWVCFDFASFWQRGTISSLNVAFFPPLFNYSKYKPWVYFVSFGAGQRCSHVPMLRGPNAGGDAALTPGSDALLGSALLLFQGKFKGVWLLGCRRRVFLLGVGKPLVSGIDGRRQNLLVNAIGKKTKKESLPPWAQYFLIIP